MAGLRGLRRRYKEVRCDIFFCLPRQRPKVLQARHTDAVDLFLFTLGDGAEKVLPAALACEYGTAGPLRARKGCIVWALSTTAKPGIREKQWKMREG